jgi:hypothetical protein
MLRLPWEVFTIILIKRTISIYLKAGNEFMVHVLNKGLIVRDY